MPADPLAINLRRQTERLLSFSSLYASEIASASSKSDLLAVLSKLLAVPAFTLTVAALYRPILFPLAASWLQVAPTEDHLVALCFLLEIHEELFPCVY